MPELTYMKSMTKFRHKHRGEVPIGEYWRVTLPHLSKDHTRQHLVEIVLVSLQRLSSAALNLFKVSVPDILDSWYLPVNFDSNRCTIVTLIS